MIKVLERTMSKVEQLSPEEQLQAAALLEDFMADDDSDDLSEAEWELIKVGLDQADRGEFATEEEVRRVFDKYK